MNSAPHSGHRERMKEKFIKFGQGAFNDHELFELLLFYSIPRKNVNEISHALIQRFGSVRGVLDADLTDLCSVEGIGMNSAVLVSLVSSLSQRAAMPAIDKRTKLNSIEKLSSYLVSLFKGESREKLYMIALDPSFRIIELKLISTGTSTYSSININRIAVEAVKCNAAQVIVAHNHPGGVAIPSSNDHETSVQIGQAMRLLGIQFVDHFVVSGNRVTPTMNSPELLFQ